MKGFLIAGILAGSFLLFNSCSKSNPVSKRSEATGAVKAAILVERVGRLGKARAVSLAKGYMEVSAEGEDTRKDSFDLSGSGQQKMETVFGDMRVKEWKLKSWALDENDSLVHIDSTLFTVVENDTVDVTLNLSPKYSMFEAKIFPIMDSSSSVIILKDGKVMVDSSFGKNADFDTLRVSFDYLPASPGSGISTNIQIDIRGDWKDPDILLWTGSKTIDLISGSDISETISLKWVGPKIGVVDITIKIGKIGTVKVDGEVQPRPGS